MNVSPDNCAAIVMFLAAFSLTQGSALAQENKINGDLPKITIGQAPISVSPKIENKNPVKLQDIGQSEIKEKSLQLRLHPKTGKPLSAQQMKEKIQETHTQLPRPLRAKRPAVSTIRAQRENKNFKAKGIQTKTLERAKVSAIGLLTEAKGGFGEQMWAGTPLALVLKLLPQLPVEAFSPVIQSLRRRLLISSAVPPEDRPGSGDVSVLDPDGSALVAARIERLAAAGDSKSVNQLLKFNPLTVENSIYSQVRLRSELLNGNVREVCRMTRNHLGSNQNTEASLMWQKIMAFCLVLEGQDSQVDLYQQVLYENGIEDEAYFNILLGLSSGEFEPLEGLVRTEPLHLAMLRAARRVIPDNASESASPEVLHAIATSPNASLTLRLEAAERAEAMGTLSAGVLRRIYASVALSAEQAADAIALADKQPSPSSRAILYQVVQIDSQIEGRARALSAAWRNGLRSGRYFTAVRANLPETRAIEPSAELAWFAGAAGRALLIAGDRVGAMAWLMAMVPLARDGHPDAAAAVLELAPLLQFGAKEGGDTQLASIIGNVLQGWWQGEVAKNDTNRYQNATRLFTALASLGHNIPAELWFPLYEMSTENQSSKQGHPALLLGLERAAEAKRRGEVVLLSLLLLGNDGPKSSDTITLGRILSALREVSLEKDAASLAIEGLMAAFYK